MIVENILPKQVYRFHCDEDMDELADWVIRDWNRYTKLYPKAFNPPDGTPYMVMDWTIPNLKKQQPKIYQFMMDSVSQVLNAMKVSYPDFYMSQVWSTIHQLHGQSHQAHKHSNSVFSSILNVSAEPPYNKTWFYPDDFEQNREIQLYIKNDGSNPNQNGPVDIQTREAITHERGDYLIFRSFIPHSVEPVEYGTRITLSANYWMNELGDRKFGTYLHTDHNQQNPAFTWSPDEQPKELNN